MRQNYNQIKDDWQLAKILRQSEKEIRRCAFQCVNLTAETEMAMMRSNEPFEMPLKHGVNILQMELSGGR